MSSRRVPAVFIRGGTSKGVFFHERDLPGEQSARDDIFLQVLGSPDPYQRQLNGMGGGISSLSKAVIIERSTRADADVDYTFAQVAVDQAIVDYSQACGNLSSAVGPFAVDEGLVQVADGDVTVKVFSTNTQQVYHAHFAVRDGRAVEAGEFEMSGVSGTGAPVRLEYLRPGGPFTGSFLPSGAVSETLDVPDVGPIKVSLVDATNPVVFLAAEQVGISGLELPDTLEAIPNLLGTLDRIRRLAGVRMGLANTPDGVTLGNPKVSMVSAPRDYHTLSGELVRADEYDVAVRMVSMERIHRAVTGTGAMCLSAAIQVDDSIPNIQGNAPQAGGTLRIGSPSGVLEVAANVGRDANGAWDVESITVFRTQRRLMEGAVLLQERA